MAKIVLGIGTSHGPMLSTPWDQWSQRVAADKKNDRHPFRGGFHSFDALVEMRRAEKLAEQITPAKWQMRHAACQAALDMLAHKLKQAAPDVTVLVGNDQKEMFATDKMPALSVYWGAAIENQGKSAEKLANANPGIAIAERGYRPEQPAAYPGQPELGRHIIESLIAEEFDVAQSDELPLASDGLKRVPHAYAFVYRRLMHDAPMPSVPVILNTFYPPNQPTAKRCHDLGRALKRAIESWPSDMRVAVIATGGLSHFVIDEDLDQKVLTAFARHDRETLISLPENLLQSGNSEIKSWIPLAAMMADCELPMTLVDYQPCYRSEAGTGNAMAFAYWG
ncbi:MAG TPA: protocatechuate 3,4-dioxygenase [Alphaproteobacteria bacterium]|jgi:3-O-methylgallate 3,4-dioxygenase